MVFRLYWVGIFSIIENIHWGFNNIHWGFNLRSYGKTQMNILTNPVVLSYF